jgi:L-ribulose-5-phosphate 3-epimerase
MTTSFALRRGSRRQFLQTSLGMAVAGAVLNRLPAAYPGLKIGVTDWNLAHTGKTTSIELAKTLGFDGVEISLGRFPTGGQPPAHLPISEPGVMEKFLEQSREHRYPIASTCLEILHQNYLKNDPLGQKWVAESIPVSQKLGARVILLPFFGKGALETKAEMDYVGDILKEHGPVAEKAGVILGVEDTISAEDNARILERANSPAVKVYYDVGNSYPRGFDIYKEIRWLGKDRICEFHLKDNPRYLGKGSIDFTKVLEAIAAIGFQGWAHLETVAPSGDIAADMKTNLAFIRATLDKTNA